MYTEKTPLWPFGFGLSYTRFVWSDPEVRKTEEGWEMSASVTNAGDRAGDEVAELYLDSAGASGQPKYRLRGFARITLEPGERRTVSFPLTEEDFTLYDFDGTAALRHGTYTAYLGGSLPDSRSRELGASGTVCAKITVS